MLVASSQPIAAAIERTDFFRRSPFALGGPGRHKEWQHFVVLAPQLDLLVNFSACDDVRPGAPQGAEFPRIVLLLREGTWDGDVETFSTENTRIVGGRIAADLSHNGLEFRDGKFFISVKLAERPIAVDLVLTPVTLPAFVPTVAMLDGPPMHWVVVPRLEATGTVRTMHGVHRLERVLTYHDHNWGCFLWGNDISWEWGFVLPEERTVPWCMTFVRLTNRSRTGVLMQNLLLWRRERLVGIYRERSFTMHADLAYARPPGVFKVPRVMALLAPETVPDVPRSLFVRAEDGNDWIECHCEARDVAQVLIPSETKLGVTIFNEVAARTTVRGLFAGEEIAFSGRSILEFIRA